ncbi:MAG: rhodanese-like domain-containing protein [Myxococcales bacterium]|nr:rhodanese-like domain-containing protein [Myxococcales bacterium]
MTTRKLALAQPVLFALALSAAPVLLGCDSPGASGASGEASATRRDVDVAALQQAVAQGGVRLVDVRSPEEFAAGHVPGAVNIPLGELGGAIDDLREGSGDLYVMCQAGGRSARAADQLRRAGISSANVEGGMGAWRAAGYPVE